MKRTEMIRKRGKMTAILNSKVTILFLMGAAMLLSSYLGSQNRILVEADFKPIKAGMTSKQVKGLLGKPAKELTLSEEIEDALSSDDERTTDRWYYDEIPDLFERFYGSEQEADKAFAYLRDSGDKINMSFNYRYGYEKNGSENYYGWHIYFIDDEVVTMYFP